jgi:16S rRNA processing protein RimM
VPEVDVKAGTVTVTPPLGLFEDIAEEPDADGTGDRSDTAAEGRDGSSAPE